MEYALSIGKRLDLSAGSIEHLRMAALLHDIGKIGIPDAILHKIDKLSDAEYGTIKAHSEIGANILKSMQTFEDLVPAIYHHHERYDGKGYPQGLRGENIPLHARIIAIADSFDAMISDRAYRDALNVETALAELESNKGTQFDPDIAHIFIEILHQSPPDMNKIMEPEWYL
jgi:HD-GYP domain-containing protein (c-di-GMP phosphodiesterase class II)